MQTENNRWEIKTGDALSVLRQMDDCSVNCCVTSPPYYLLRDYGIDGQIGLESTPESYIQRLTDVFAEVYRVLTNDGTLWVNLGDTYNTISGQAKWVGDKQRTNEGSIQESHNRILRSGGLKPKDLIGLPWMLAFALRNYGWYLRSDIIWHKPNSMPQSCEDRCSSCHEYIFMLTKSKRYYFDYNAIEEKATYNPKVFSDEYENQNSDDFFGCVYNEEHTRKRETKPCNTKDDGSLNPMRNKHIDFCEVRRKRDVWSVPTKGFSGAHFATFPEKLIEPCILAGCPKGGLVLDPFNGSGTTGVVALKNDRRYVGIELNPEYVGIATKRIAESDRQMTLGI